MIKVSNLSFSYGKSIVLNSISCNIPTGKITALVGSNGSGKTTLFNILVGLVTPLKGEIFNYSNEIPVKINSKDIGVVFQSTTSDEKLTLFENLLLHSKLYSLNVNTTTLLIDEYLEKFALTNEKNTFVKKLSGGSKRKVDIIRSLIHKPKILFYDEPFVHVDVETKNEIWNILQKEVASNNLTLLFSTHSLSEVEYADNIIVIKKGEIVFQDLINNFKKFLSHKIISIPINYYLANKKNFLEYNMQQITQNDSTYRFKILDLNSLKTILQNNPELLEEMTIENPDIEDIYLSSFNNKN